MNIWFIITMIAFIVISVSMILIILVQRPQGGGLAGAFGGAGGGGTDTVFGGRVGDALTTITVCAFVIYIGLAIGLNKIDTAPQAVPVVNPSPGISSSTPFDANPDSPAPLPVSVTDQGTTGGESGGLPGGLEITPVKPEDVPFDIQQENRERQATPPPKPAGENPPPTAIPSGDGGE